MNQSDPFNLQRFVDTPSRWYQLVRAELKAGCKSSHWMWLIFPNGKDWDKVPSPISTASGHMKRLTLT